MESATERGGRGLGPTAPALLFVAHFALSWLAATFDGASADRDLPWFAFGCATLMMSRFSGPETVVGAVLIFVSALSTGLLTGSDPATALAGAGIALAEVMAALAVLGGSPGSLGGRTSSDWLTRVGIVGVAVPGLGALLTALVAERLDAGAVVHLAFHHWTGEATGTLFLLVLVALFGHRGLGEKVEPHRLVRAVLSFLVSLGLMWAAATRLPDLLPLAVLPLLLSGLRLPAFHVGVETAVALATLLVARWAMHSAEGAETRAILFLSAATLVAAVPGALALLRAEIAVERRRLAASERHFHDAMQNSPFGMALLRPDGVCFSVNRALCDLLGYEAHELVGRRPPDITYDETDEQVNHRLKALATGEIGQYAVEKQYARKDGSPIWMLVAVSVVRDETDGHPLYFISQLKDIEARRRAEKALELAESRWNFALESAGQGVWDYDYRSRDTFYSPMWSHMLGYETGELPTEEDAWLSLVHPHDLPGLLQAESRHLEGATEQFECEFRMRRRDGRWVWILDRGKVIARDEEGKPLRMIGTHTDITEHRRLTEALQAEKERLRITLQSIGDGVICTDEHGLVTFVNPIAASLTGWPEAIALGRHCTAVFRIERDDDDGDVYDCPISQALTTRERISLKDGVVLVGRSGARIDIEATASPVSKQGGELLGAVLVFQDVTRARTLQRELARLASHDALTGLRNRTSFERTLGEHCATTARDGGVHALCFVDLDRFKIINDTAGHAAGDALLREVARLVREQMRRQDMVARLGGDEFGILLLDCEIDDARVIAERLIERIGRIRFSWDGRVYEVGASIGIARIDADTPLAADVMSRADVACYAAKAAGRNRVSIYHLSEGDARRHHAELHTAAGIRAALDTDRFVVYAQEIRDLRPSGSLHTHCELLVRMRDESGALLPPGAFIPAAERYGLMASIDRWMIGRVLHHYDEAILAVPRLSVSINLSANSLDDPTLLEFLAESLDVSALPPHRLSFEITETSLINNLTNAGRLVEDLRAAGHAIMLDDFGAGLSSFAYLEQFPADYLKIDGGFVRKLATHPLDRAIVESINDVGHKIGAVTIAEFVEDETTLDLVREIGIDMAQGWWVGHPEPLEDLLARLGGAPVVSQRPAE